MKITSLLSAAVLVVAPTLASAASVPFIVSGSSSIDTGEIVYSPCALPAEKIERIQQTLGAVVRRNNGGLFSPSRMWSAVVDRKGTVCSVIKIGDSWPGSRAIALAKAFTANAFSNGGTGGISLSTTMLYASTQPGGSLWGLNESNPFNADFARAGSGIGRVAAGVITFGGGVALYENGLVIGGLGLSGDTSCADHVIAYRMRRQAGFDHIPTGVLSSDNISYPSSGPATGFEQPHCFPNLDLPPNQI